MDLGRIGIWSAALRNSDRETAASAAAELEQLGYGAQWFPGGPPEGVTDHITALLKATRRVVIATGILSIWTHSAADVTNDFWNWEQRAPGRFLLGIGISHQPVVERAGLTYQK